MWAPLRPHVGVDICDRVEADRDAIACVASQVGDIEAAFGRNAVRGLRVDVAQAEAFHRVAARPWVRLCAGLIV